MVAINSFVTSMLDSGSSAGRNCVFGGANLERVVALLYEIQLAELDFGSSPVVGIGLSPSVVDVRPSLDGYR